MKKIETIKPSLKNSFEIMLLMMLMLPIGTLLYRTIVGDALEYKTGPDGILATAIITIVIHEVLHALGYILAGAIPKLGVGLLGILPVAYTTVGNKKILTVTQVLFAGYLPFILLSILLIMAGLLFPMHRQITSFAFIINFASSAGDLYIATRLWKYTKIKNTRLLDTKEGFEVYTLSNQHSKNS